MMVPAGWEVRRLDTCGTIVSGATPSTTVSEFWDGDIAWLTPLDLNKLSSAYITESTKRITEAGLRACSTHLTQPGRSLVVSSRAPIGYVGIPLVPFCTSQGCKTISFRDDIDPLFAYYNLLFHTAKVRILGEGTTFAEISKTALSAVALPFPKRLGEQEHIADILSTMDRAIEQTEQFVAKLRRTKSGLMRALLSGGLDESGDLRSETTHRFVDSAVGKIPDTWWVPTVGELFELRRERGRPGLPVMSIVMNDGLVERSSVERRVVSNLPPEGHALVRGGDIAYNMMRMWQGVLGRAQFDCVVSPAYVVLKPKNTINSRFAEWLFRDQRSIRKFRQASRGVVDDRLRLYPHDLFAIKCAIPRSLAEQEAIATTLETIKHNIEAEVENLDHMGRLRAGLMQDLLTGRKSVGPVLEAKAMRERVV